MTVESVTGTTRPEKLEEVDDLWRYEEERRRRQKRLNRISRRIVAVFVAASLATLAYDSGHAAWALHKYRPLATPHGRLAYASYLDGSWVYPATISTISTVTALLILAFAVRRRRRRGAHRSTV